MRCRAFLWLLAFAGSGCESGEKVNAMTAVTPQSHEQYFPILTGKHAGIDCNSCHGAFGTFKEFTCLGCHKQPDTDPFHSGIAGYSYSSPSCYSCHPKGTASAVDHSAFFPIAAGAKHQGIACSNCHIDPNNRKAVDCVSCHTHDAAPTATFHAEAGGYDYQTPLCLKCHADGQVNRITAHLPFGLTSAFKHYRQSCLRCHPQLRADKPFPAADFKAAECVVCHAQAKTDPLHTTVPGYRYTSVDCYWCHPQGTIAGVNHTFFPIATGDKHAGIACANCHADPNNRKVIDCVTCHTSALMDPAHTDVGGYQFQTSRCLLCHADSQVKRVALHLPFGISAGYKHYRKSCVLCHNQLRADKPFAATDFSKPGYCLGCHGRTAMDDTHQGFPGYRYDSLTCIQSGCHANGRKP